MEELPCLTLANPWAAAVATGAKDTENRITKTAYRGPFAVHSRLQDDETGWENPLVKEWLATVTDPATGWPRGKIVGVVDLIDVHPAQGDTDVTCCTSRWALTTLWGVPVGYHYVLGDARPLAWPVPARGMMGWWRMPPTVLEAVLDQVKVTA